MCDLSCRVTAIQWLLSLSKFFQVYDVDSCTVTEDRHMCLEASEESCQPCSMLLKICRWVGFADLQAEESFVQQAVSGMTMTFSCVTQLDSFFRKFRTVFRSFALCISTLIGQCFPFFSHIVKAPRQKAGAGGAKQTE